MLDIHRVSAEAVNSVDWNGDPLEYDCNLYQLGQGFPQFLVVNPEMENYSHYINNTIQSEKCVVWNLEGQWVAKKFNKGWNPNKGYEVIEIEIKAPTFTWRKNPDLDRTMTFEDDPFSVYEPEPWDWHYELIWYIDPRFNPLEDKVWAISCKPISGKCLGIKDMGYVIPDVNIEINDETPTIPLDLDSLCPPYWELSHECAYKLDPIHCPDNNEIWVVKFLPAYRKPKEWKWVGTISPEFHVEYNPVLPKMDYEIDYVVPWYDIGYDHVWNLDKAHLQNGEDDIWAFKIVTGEDSKGTKIIGEVSPEVKVIYNQDIPKMDYDIDVVIPWHDLKYEHVWNLDKEFIPEGMSDVWAVKIRACAKCKGTKLIGQIKPNLIIEYNPDLPDLDYDIDFNIPFYDTKYEHVWMLDKKHYDHLPYDIWAVKARYTEDIEGSKFHGSVSPKVKWKKNTDLPDLKYNIEYEFLVHDFEYEHLWMLDPIHTKDAPEEIWAIKASLVKRDQGTKIVDYVRPEFVVEINDEIETYKFDIPALVEQVQHYNFRYTNQWKLHEDYAAGFEIWAIRINFLETPRGLKNNGLAEPKSVIEFNPDLSHLSFTIDYQIPYHDSKYIHVWYLDPSFSGNEKIWAARQYTSKKARGEKEVGYIVPDIPDYLDVIFISYQEPHAEENWERLKLKAPWAKRVKDVKGIFEAHRAAATMSRTDMFYVVDGDAWITDNFDFKFQPSLFDRDCAYVWYSSNPITDMTYGYGGVKLFSKSVLEGMKQWKNLDLASTMPKLKVVSQVSCVTKFNVDELSTWRSAFREVVKLCYNIEMYSEDPSHSIRLKSWLNADLSKSFGIFAKHGAECGHQFFKDNFKGGKLALNLINDRQWLAEEFYKYNPTLRKE